MPCRFTTHTPPWLSSVSRSPSPVSSASLVDVPAFVFRLSCPLCRPLVLLPCQSPPLPPPPSPLHFHFLPSCPIHAIFFVKDLVSTVHSSLRLLFPFFCCCLDIVCELPGQPDLGKGSPTQFDRPGLGSSPSSDRTALPFRLFSPTNFPNECVSYSFC